MSKEMPKKPQIKGLRIVRKGALLWQTNDQNSAKTLSHLSIAEFRDKYTGSHYEILYHHLN